MLEEVVSLMYASIQTVGPDKEPLGKHGWGPLITNFLTLLAPSLLVHILLTTNCNNTLK